MSIPGLPHEMIRASAGSGKTHQLTNRYLALLVAGVHPASILATTFTRKAAGEILNRVLERLAKAAAHAKEAAALSQQIQHTSVNQAEWATLLQQMLHNLHRVRIGTLDSFFISLAGCYSLELGLPANWAIGDELEDQILRRHALEQLLEEHPEEVRHLLPGLYRGDIKRSILDRLLAEIHSSYELFQSTPASAWSSLTIPRELPDSKRAELRERLLACDLTILGDRRIPIARDKDMTNVTTEDWHRFISTGLAAKVLAGKTTYYSKEIPKTVRSHYVKLLDHAKSKILQKIKQQTVSLRDLLKLFHHQYARRKAEHGGLRFSDVTQTLVAAVQQSPSTFPNAASLPLRLDGNIDHLLLDEFQDTSLSQWRVLEPLARRITHQTAGKEHSFFCVGDEKQAIYGWRGGMAEIFQALEPSLGSLQQRPLLESRRSAQPVIDVVNMVFSRLHDYQPDEKYLGGLAAWSQRFQEHTTVKKEVPGYVRVETGPGQQPDESLAAQRGQHCHAVAEKIRELALQAPGHTVGVLCRKNGTVARMMYELRHLGINASEEGGNPLTDSAAVEVILSLLKLADHPSDTVAWFHVHHSPLREHLALLPDADTLARQIRQALLDEGYGAWTYLWASRLAPACAVRDLRRLQQLVEMAYDYQARSTLRADDFIAWVREQRVPDPSGVNIRVMTIHSAKGLQFDTVVLPELDEAWLGQSGSYVVGRDPGTLEANFICPVVSEEIQALLAPTEQLAFQKQRQNDIEESLCLLYVAMTRAIHGLYLYLPGPRSRNDKPSWHHLLLQTIAPDKAWDENTILYEHGDSAWFSHLEHVKVAPASTPPAQPLVFNNTGGGPRRGREHVAPSRREGNSHVNLGSYFQGGPGIGAALGTLYHSWFASIGWLENDFPSDEELVAIASKQRPQLPAIVWNDIDKYLVTFKNWLKEGMIAKVLRRSAYASPDQPGFPSLLKPLWTPRFTPQKVDRERRFLVPDGEIFLDGTIDRIVWLYEGETLVAVDILDFKTDSVSAEENESLATRVDYYRPQMEAYRRAIAKVSRLPSERIAVRMVFTSVKNVVAV